MVWGGWIEVGSSGIWPDRECMSCCQGGTRIWLDLSNFAFFYFGLGP